MDQAEWNLLDRQGLGVVRLMLTKNVAYNIVSEKTTYGTVTALASRSGTMKLTFNGIRDFILNEDIRRKNLGETSGSLLSTDSIGRKSEKEQSSGRGRSKSKKRGQSKPRKDITCWSCQKKGYFKYQFTAPTVPKGMKPDNSVNAAQEDVDKSTMYKDMFAVDAEGTKKPPEKEKEKAELEDITEKRSCWQQL
ncbi:hypothetical protein AKJ16_DCAP18802 [Drosera capensis]